MRQINLFRNNILYYFKKGNDNIMLYDILLLQGVPR